MNFLYANEISKNGNIRIQTQLLRLCVQSLNKNFDMII